MKDISPSSVIDTPSQSLLRRFLRGESLSSFVASLNLTVITIALSGFMHLAQAQPSQVNSSDSLLAGFAAPPDSAKPLTLWQWMNGNVTQEGITSDLESFKRVGLAGTQQFLVGGSEMKLTDPTVQILNPKWRDLMKFAMDESARLGLSFGTHNSPGWSSSGGPQVKVEQSMQKLVWTTQELKGPGAFNVTLAQANVDPKWNYYRDIAVFAVAASQSGAAEPPIDRKAVIDLTGKMDKDGRLVWDAPEGNWTLLRFGHTTTGKINGTAPDSGQGLEVDKMSRSAFDAFWSGFPSEVVKFAGKNAGKTLQRFEIDSYEAGAQDWTPRMREEFQQRRGYDPLPRLPALAGLTIENKEMTDRFREDWRLTIEELFADNYFGYMRELIHRVPGMKLLLEPYGTGTGAVFDNSVVAGAADILMCEFWQKPATWGWDSVKPVASSAHVWGKRIIAAEAFTGQPQYAWLSDPYALKSTGDRAFCGGVNQMVLHASAHQAWPGAKPGMTMGWWGTHFGPGQTWWEHGGPQWIAYLSRCQFLLQQGLFVGDIAYLGRGRLSPKPPLGYEGDGLAESAFLTRASVKNGRLVLPGGMSYRVLVLPNSQTMTPQVARKIRQLVQDGATIIGRKPTRAPGMGNYPASEAEVVQIGNEVWGNADGKTVHEHAFGKGKVVWGKSPEDALSQMGVEPDVKMSQDLLWIHRRVGNTEIYFFSNQKDEPMDAEVSFRVQGLQPELWQAESGETKTVALYRAQNGRTIVPLRLGPSESVFVVFRKPASNADPVVAVQRDGKEVLSVSTASPSTKIQIVKATYGVTGDAARSFDVTAKVQALVDRGVTSIPVANLSKNRADDPALGMVKTLRVEYGRDGRALTASGDDTQTLALVEATPAPAAQDGVSVQQSANGRLLLETRQAGNYVLKTALGRQLRTQIKAVPAPLSITGSWNLRFPAGWGAPPQVTLTKLASWTEHANPGVKYFSGTATYAKEIDVPSAVLSSNRRFSLDLGQVKNIAAVSINGKSMGVLWKPPFRVDVGSALKPGKNRLEVRVTNLWPNRLIGDEQEPDDVKWGDVKNFASIQVGRPILEVPEWLKSGTPRPSKGRYTLTSFKFFNKDSPLLESGLLGPVNLEVTERRIIDSK